MALADLTKQLAQQAILSATSSPKEQPAPAPAAASNSGLVFLAQIQAMQKSLKEEEELVLTFASGSDKIRVLEIFLPSPEVVVLGGIDANRQATRAICAVDALQLVSRVAKVAPGAKPVRIGLVTAKAKDSGS